MWWAQRNCQSLWHMGGPPLTRIHIGRNHFTMRIDISVSPEKRWFELRNKAMWVIRAPYIHIHGIPSKAIITRILIPQCCTHPYLNIIRLKPKSLSLLDLPFPLLLIGAWKRTATFPSLSWESRGVQWRRYLYILGGVYAR